VKFAALWIVEGMNSWPQQQQQQRQQEACHEEPWQRSFSGTARTQRNSDPGGIGSIVAQSEEESLRVAMQDSFYLGGSATFGQWRRTAQEMQEQMERDTASPDPPRWSSEHHQPQNWFVDNCPRIYACLARRFSLGSRKAVFVTVGFIVASILKFLMSDQLELENVNQMSVIVFTHFCSGFLALAVCFCLEGSSGQGTVYYFSFGTLRRFLGIAGMFTLATLNLQNAHDLGVSTLATNTVGFAFVLVSALFSMVILERTYGILEWFSIGIMTLAVMTFLDLRNAGIAGSDVMGTFNLLTVILVLASATVSALASILTERIYKGRSNMAGSRGIASLENGNFSSALREPCPRSNATGQGAPYHVYKVHLDCASLIVSTAVWLIFTGRGASPVWFGDWHWKVAPSVAISVFHSWFAGWVTKEFSTVTRAIMDTLVNVLLVFLVKPLLGDHRFYSGSIPSALLALIIVIAALVFQTGRLNVQTLLAQMPARADVQRRSMEADDGRSSGLARNICQLLSPRSLGRHLLTYSSMILFIVSDASRTLFQQQALSRSMITPQTMVLACYAGGIAVASMLIVVSGPSCGLGGLRQAYSPRRILRYLPCGILFALASTLLAAAYALGISPALSTALGYLYIPVAALASRFVLGRFYMWLEWLALVVLTFACAAFGFLQNFFSTHGSQGSNEHGSPLLAMLLVVASAVASVMASLVAERVLQAEDHLPFRVQKVCLDIGSLVATLALLPLIGAISNRPQDAFWKTRPIDAQCPSEACWKKSSAGYCSDPQCTCACSNAFWVAWGNWAVILALVVNVLQGWLTGVVIKQFSTVLRAIAQGTTLLAIYFVGDPLLNGSSVHNLTLTLVAFIVPLSTALFNTAVSELEKVMALIPAPAHQDEASVRTGQQEVPLSAASDVLASEVMQLEQTR